MNSGASNIGTSDLIGVHNAPRWAGASVNEFEDAVRHNAIRDGIRLSDDHWRAIRAVVTVYAEHGNEIPSARVISDALDLQFAATGGRKHLYHLFPKGPVGQICKLAEMPQPSGVSDGGFGYSL